MKRVFLFLALAGLVVISTNAQERLTAKSETSKLEWLGEKVTGEHSGTINLLSGWISWKDNKIVSGEFDIDMNSLKDKDGSARLETHLKSEDFFGVEKFPVSKLVIKESTPFEKGTAVVKGDLTIKGVTQPVEFKAAMQKKDTGVWFYANITVDRTKYNVRYGSGTFFDNLGDRTIYDEFKLKVTLNVM